MDPTRARGLLANAHGRSVGVRELIEQYQQEITGQPARVTVRATYLMEVAKHLVNLLEQTQQTPFEEG